MSSHKTEGKTEGLRIKEREKFQKLWSVVSHTMSSTFENGV